VILGRGQRLAKVDTCHSGRSILQMQTIVRAGSVVQAGKHAGLLFSQSISGFRNAFWPWTLCSIFMHWEKTFPPFSTRKYGKYAVKKISPECNLPLKRTVSSGNETNHVCVIPCATKSVHCLCFIASLTSPLSSEALIGHELVGSGQFSGSRASKRGKRTN
jgi:hypothetical protein